VSSSRPSRPCFFVAPGPGIHVRKALPGSLLSLDVQRALSTIQFLSRTTSRTGHAESFRLQRLRSR
jgi:hypothetical protein